ncbi:MAG: DUF485 domain-containing protein [Pirellulaceae bacterium]
MPGFEPHAVTEHEPEDPRTDARNARYGLILFAAYSAVYAAFVGANAFKPAWMAQTPWAGVNLAVLSGLALILGAFALSLVYGWLCRVPVSSSQQPPGGEM